MIAINIKLQIYQCQSHMKSMKVVETITQHQQFMH